MLTFIHLGHHGQLANQLFQIASTIGVARKNNHDYVFPKWGHTPHFKKAIPQSDNIKYVKQLNYPDWHYHDIKISEPNSQTINLMGYYQHENYFKHVESDIRQYFDFKDDIVAKLQQKYGDLSRTCSIHVRRSDYVNNPHYQQLSRYYKNCADYFNQRSIVQKYLVFSDDLSWCEKAFPSIPQAKGNTNIEDLCLMSMCKNNIIANSSFSWWAAWLNSSPDKIVLAPSKWFGDSATNNNPSNDTKMVIPSWIKINN